MKSDPRVTRSISNAYTTPSLPNSLLRSSPLKKRFTYSLRLLYPNKAGADGIDRSNNDISKHPSKLHRCFLPFINHTLAQCTNLNWSNSQSTEKTFFSIIRNNIKKEKHVHFSPTIKAFNGKSWNPKIKDLLNILLATY